MRIIKLSFEGLRSDKHLSQEDVAKHLGISTVAYGRKERGVNEFTFKEVLKLAKLYDVTVDTFKYPGK